MHQWPDFKIVHFHLLGIDQKAHQNKVDIQIKAIVAVEGDDCCESFRLAFLKVVLGSADSLDHRDPQSGQFGNIAPVVNHMKSHIIRLLHIPLFDHNRAGIGPHFKLIVI